MKEITLSHESQQFIEEHQNYKNNYGKISPYVYVTKKYNDHLNNLLISSEPIDQKMKLLTEYINDGFYTLQEKARELKIPSELFDYVAFKNLKKIEIRVLHNKSIHKAISSLYMACLSGDNLAVYRKE